MKKFLFACFVIVTSFMFTSCGPAELTVTARPDAPYYVRPASPGYGYVWIEGDWVVRNGHYQWREGHWARTRSRVWISGSWESRGSSGWYWRRGHWQ